MFSQSIVEPFFPTLVWIRDLEAGLASRLNDEYKQHFSALVDTTRRRGSLQTTQDLHRHAEFAELVEVINASAADVLKFLEVDHDFEISGCWANFGAKGAAHAAHHHSNNYLSGVYYVHTPPGGNVITFHDPRTQVEQIAPQVKKHNAHNSTAHAVTVQTGQVLLFPAWLIHSVPPNGSPEVRISISFNIIFSRFSETVAPPQWSGVPYDAGRSRSS